MESTLRARGGYHVGCGHIVHINIQRELIEMAVNDGGGRCFGIEYECSFSIAFNHHARCVRVTEGPLKGEGVLIVDTQTTSELVLIEI